MRRPRCLLALTVLLAAALAPQARADVFGTTSLVSGDPIQQADYAHDPAISADGRFVVFDGAVGGVNGVWRRELATGKLDEVAGGDAVLPSVSADGRYVGFTTNQGGQLPAFSDGRQHFASPAGESPNVYVRDMAMGAQQPGAFEIVSARSGSSEPLRYLPPPGSNATEEYGALAAGRSAMSADGSKVVFVTTAVSNLTSYPQLELEELEHGETPKPRTPALQVAVRDLQTGVTRLVSVRRDPATGVPALSPETGEPEPVATRVENGVHGAVDVEGVLPFFRADVPAYARTEKVGASISADGSTVAWMGQQLGEQVASLPAEPAEYNWTEPVWRRIADGELAPTRKVAGGSDPESAPCQASGEQRLPPSPVPGDPCQGPFETRLTNERNEGDAGVWTGDPEDDSVPKLSGDGYTVAFLARAPPFGLAGQDGGHSDLFLADMRPGLTRAQAVRPLTRFASQHADALATNAAITDVAISRNASAARRAGQIAFTTMRTVFPLGSPSYISARAAAPGLNEIYDVDLGNDTLTRVTQGYEGGPAGHPFGEEKSDVQDPYLRFGQDDGALAPSFDGGGTRLAFSSTASNLIFGDNNTPPCCAKGLEDGADVFLVGRITFAASAPEQAISALPPNPAPDVPWTLSVTAQSLRNGRVRLYLGLPAAGALRVTASGSVPVRRAAGHGAARKASRVRTIASASGTSTVGAGFHTVELTLASRYRSLARRKGGVAASTLVTFTAPAHPRLQKKLRVRFVVKGKAASKR